MTTQNWTLSDIPDLVNKTVVITGANSGIGFEVTKLLAAKNATVVMACRDIKKAEQAVNQIRQTQSNAQLYVMSLDLASLQSIREFAAAFKQRYSQINILINNAGVMKTPQLQTAEGIEYQWGVNHIGHFALTGLLLEKLLSTPNSRIVSVTSIAHQMAQTIIDTPDEVRKYNPMKAYAQSKLANLMFIYELQRKLAAHSANTIAVAAHPGISPTQLNQRTYSSAASVYLEKLLGHKPQYAALPIVMASTHEDIHGGDYIGPSGFLQLKGKPGKVVSSALSQNTAAAQTLWAASEHLSGVVFQFRRI
ncbi:MAG: SDR family NAD(P)-dependent oxidoreductase [Gammaproteobacteria bacterium]|nr:SDR family NAD(P)-dependent oxidoreductase [Gammaproteobacteria bacterium]